MLPTPMLSVRYVDEGRRSPADLLRVKNVNFHILKVCIRYQRSLFLKQTRALFLVGVT